MQIAQSERDTMKRGHLSVNVLAVIAGLVMVAAMFFPWWSFRLSYTPQTNLYPYLISGPGSELVGYHRSPQMALLTGVLIACIVLCLVGGILKGRPGRIMLFVSSLLVFLASWRLLARVGGVAARFKLPIQGHGWGEYGGFAHVEVWTWLQPGLYLILLGGALALVAGLLYHRVSLEIA